MAKYVFFNFPAHGHVNPTLAIVEELLARGEQVVYYLTESFRQTIEATGATFRPYKPDFFKNEESTRIDPAAASKQLAMLPIFLIQQSARVLPFFLESIRAEQADCLLYDSMFLWARFAGEILHIPAVALRPTYAANKHSNLFTQHFPLPPAMLPTLDAELAQLSATYALPLYTMRDIFMNPEQLIIVFIPRAFHPAGDTFDERFLFVGPSLQPQRPAYDAFPSGQLDTRPLLYISLGTVFNNWPAFFQLCFAAFGASEWQVVLSIGGQVDRESLPAIPHNFIVAPHVPQLEVLPRTAIFITHGGMNSTMEGLYYGVPLVVIPQIVEQEITAARVQELGLGIALDRTTITADGLRAAVAQITQDASFRTQAQSMQQIIHTAGGYLRATNAIVQFVQKNMP